MPRRRRGDGEGKAEPAEGGAKRGRRGFWPFYLIGALLVAGIIATALLGDRVRAQRGLAFLGDPCERSQDCGDRRAVCYPVDERSICVRTCSGPGAACPEGTTCTSIGEHKRRRQLRVRNLCIPN